MSGFSDEVIHLKVVRRVGLFDRVYRSVLSDITLDRNRLRQAGRDCPPAGEDSCTVGDQVEADRVATPPAIGFSVTVDVILAEQGTTLRREQVAWPGLRPARQGVLSAGDQHRATDRPHPGNSI